MNPIRPGHGTGADAPHVELPLKDLTPANADQTAANLAARQVRGRPFELRNQAAANRPPSLALLGIEPETLPEPTRKEIRRARAYRQRRLRELAAVTGYVSAGAGAVLSTAALTLASHRQVAALAFQTGDPALHALAAKLAEKHSQLEIKASWLAKNEAGRKEHDPAAANRALSEALGGGK